MIREHSSMEPPDAFYEPRSVECEVCAEWVEFDDFIEGAKEVCECGEVIEVVMDEDGLFATNHLNTQENDDE